MARREHKIPVHIHKNNDSEKNDQSLNHVDYLEVKQEENVEELISKKTDQEPKMEKMDEQAAENIMDGLIEHQKETPRPHIDEPDRRHIILWVFVSVFVLAILVVWAAVLRSNFMQVSAELGEQDEKQAYESISESFKSNFEIIKESLGGFDELKESIENEQTQTEAINELKNEIEQEEQPGQLPDTN